MKDLLEIKSSLLKLQGRRNLLKEQLENIKSSLEKERIIFDNTTKARTVVQIVAKDTQKNLEWHISNLVSMALRAIFPDPYTFTLRFEERRNKTEADLIFSKKGNETDDILNSGGGGVADIASIALRMALWSIKKTAPIIILDEATKFLHSPVYQEKASTLLKEISEKLGVQIIMISDQRNIIGEASNIIEITNDNGVSKVVVEEEVKKSVIRRRGK